MITYVDCDLFQSPARVLVNTVNTVGVMGKGIAKEFKRIYPEMFREYQQICEKGAFETGSLWLYKTPHKWVLNFPTKRNWRQPSHPDYIEAGLQKFAATYHVYGITSISFPMLGCGNGELDWKSQVQPLMEKYLTGLPVSAFVHTMGFDGAPVPEHRDARTIRRWLRNDPESLAFTEVWDDLCSELGDGVELEDANNGETFTARVISDPAALVVDTENGTCKIPAEAILELWQQTRGAGFVSGTDFPCGLDFYANLVVPVMTRLPYVEPVVLEHGHGSLLAQVSGIRLAPMIRSTKHAEPRQPAQLPLLVT